VDPGRSDFLTHLPAAWKQFVVRAATDTGLDVYCTPSPSKDQVAVYTTEGDLTLFWTRFRRLREVNR